MSNDITAASSLIFNNITIENNLPSNDITNGSHKSLKNYAEIPYKGNSTNTIANYKIAHNNILIFPGNIQYRGISSQSTIKGVWRSKLKNIRRAIVHEEDTVQRKALLEGSQKVVALAIISNFLMFGSKMYAATSSGSASMFAEAAHSLADMLNESLLMWGLFRSLRIADGDHPYGFLTEKYAWALVSGCGIFFLGGGVALYHGVSGIIGGVHVLGNISTSLGVLGASLCFELITMKYAYSHINLSAKLAGVSFIEYLKCGADPTSVQVFMEDVASVFGIAIAGTMMTLAKYFELAVLDSVGSIMIGILLSSVAMFLIRRNISSLTEAALDPVRENEIVDLLEADPVVTSVHDVKSTSLGPEWARFKGKLWLMQPKFYLMEPK